MLRGCVVWGGVLTRIRVGLRVRVGIRVRVGVRSRFGVRFGARFGVRFGLAACLTIAHFCPVHAFDKRMILGPGLGNGEGSRPTFEERMLFDL